MNKTRFDFRKDAIAAAVQMYPQLNLDANEALYFGRQLELVRSKIFETKRPKPSAFELFPVDSSVPDFVETITYTMYDETGFAKLVGAYADDLPRVGLNAKQFSSTVKTIGVAYGWSTAEIRAAMGTGIPLKSRLASVARKTHTNLGNQIAWFGDAEANLPGFLTNVNIPEYTIPANGTGSSKKWVDKTSDQIYDDMNQMVNQVVTQSKGLHRPNQLWLPLNQYTFIKNKKMSQYTDTTIWKAWTDANPGIEIKAVLELAAVPNFANQDVMVAIENYEDNYQFIIPMLFTEHAPQARNLSVEIPCESRIGGVVFYYPLAFVFGKGL